MAKKTSKNNDLLYNAKEKTNPKLYSLIVGLVNKDMDEEAKIVLKIDYLLDYTSRCIKLKDYREAKEALESAKTRIDKLENIGVDISYLEYLYDGIKKKIK